MAKDQKDQTNRLKNYRYLYGRESEEEKIEYEVVELPLQDKIAILRRATTKNWKSIKEGYTRIKKSSVSSYNSASKQISERLKSVGIVDTQTALQGGSIFGASVVGVYLARKKSKFSRVLYPVMAGVGTWTIFYLAYESNRQLLKKKAATLWYNLQKSK